MLYRLIRPALFLLDPERAHGAALAMLKALPLGGSDTASGPLATTVAGAAPRSVRASWATNPSRVATTATN